MSMAGGVVSGTVDVDVDGRSVYLSGGTGDLHLADALGPKCTIAFKTRFQPMAMGWIDLGGTRVLLGESPGGGPMTGSIEGHDEVRAGLVADRSWAHMSIELTPHVASRLVTVRIAGLPVASAIVPADSVSGPLRVGHKSETGWVALSDLSIVE